MPGLLVPVLLVVAAALAPVVALRSLASSPTAAPTSGLLRLERDGPPGAPVGRLADPTTPPRAEHRGVLGAVDGLVPKGTTVFDDDVPAVRNLDAALLRALRDAAAAAAGDGVDLLVESGWRSAAYQDELLGEAILAYGSAKEAARWVATASTSPHVSGDAVDLGPAAAAAWLSRHGAQYGLCQIYRNEPWHYELRASAIDDGCPRMYADPTHDPRMQG